MRKTMAITALVSMLLTACAGTAQLTKNTETNNFSMDAVVLRNEGLGFLTPVSATGQEADRVALAIAFAEAIEKRRSNLPVVRLAEVLSAVNQAGLSSDYKQMMEDYRATGILERHTLRKVGDASGARYLGLLGLAEFSQGASKRFGIGGLRLFDTKTANLRLSWQIWDSRTGTIAWEGSDEINYAYDTGREKPVEFGFVAEQAAGNMIESIPAAGTSSPPPALAGLSTRHAAPGNPGGN